MPSGGKVASWLCFLFVCRLWLGAWCDDQRHPDRRGSRGRRHGSAPLVRRQRPRRTGAARAALAVTAEGGTEAALLPRLLSAAEGRGRAAAPIFEPKLRSCDEAEVRAFREGQRRFPQPDKRTSARQRMNMRALVEVAGTFRSLGVPVVLLSGMLLGWRRGCMAVPGDADVDLGTFGPPLPSAMETGAAYEALPGGVGKAGGGGTSLGASVVNLVKVIVGCGAFSLPQGVASFSDETAQGLAFGAAAMLVLASASAYCYWQIGRICAVTCEDTYAGAFGKIFGERWQRLVSLTSAVFCGTVTIMYSIVIADNSHDLAAGFGLSGLAGSRSALLAALGLVVLLPLSLLRSLSALTPFSALGLLGLLFTDGFCVWRFVQGAYEPGGEFFEDVRWQPSFDTLPPRILPGFVLTSMMATAFISHFSAPRFWRELERPTVQRFAVMTALGFTGAVVTIGAIMIFGFLTFGSASQGLILNNYAVTDQLAVMSRIGVLASVICSYPFLVATVRDDFLQLAIPGDPSEVLRTTVTVAIVLVATAVGMVFDDLGFLSAFIGAVLATALIYLFPTAMLIGHLSPRVRAGSASRAEWLECRFNQALLALGVMLAVVGAAVSVLKYFWPEALSSTSH